MIAKFLYTTGPNGHFPAVSYNTGKMDRNKGELMKVANFGPLQGLSQMRPNDYKNYLKMVSTLNKSVKKPQFHVAISGEGRSYDKHELTEIAAQWMERMGYGKQPYLIVFHKDTNNNHVHIVSTRVGPDGKKIRDSYEQIKGLRQMNVVMGIDEKHNATADTAKALSYRFNTKAQFLMILESMGYSHKEEDGRLLLFKFGKQQGDLKMAEIDSRLGVEQVDENRKKQLTALFHKYGAVHDTLLYRYHNKYQSGLSAWLKEKMGIELVFHASGDKPPYGYTVIDHAQRIVFKGGDIMPLKELLSIQSKPETKAEHLSQSAEPVSNQRQLRYYAAILKAVLHNYPDLVQGLHHQGLTLTRQGDNFFLNDPGAGVAINADELLDEKDYRMMYEQFDNFSASGEQGYRQHIYVPGISISDDIDDEAIHGRRRKKRARTNHR